MMSKLKKENKILAKLNDVFDITGEIKSEKRVSIKADRKNVSSILLFLKNQKGYIHLNHISCVDWIEENEFELVYIVWNPKTKITVLVHTRIDRENPVMENIDTIWDQANTYEREFREMFGIEFPGLVGAKEFILEDWDNIPPMRKDFNSQQYAKDTFTTRPGRENAQNVREAIQKRSGEEIPDFAKKYSRD
jgi:NADH-quinone oxidoreductase subunit C